MMRYLKWYKEEQVEIGAECKYEHLQMLIGEAADAYKEDLPPLELERENRVLHHFKARLRLLSDRRLTPHYGIVGDLLKKVSFLGVLGLHDSYELRVLQTDQKFQALAQKQSHKLERARQARAEQRRLHQEKMLLLEQRVKTIEKELGGQDDTGSLARFEGGSFSTPTGGRAGDGRTLQAKLLALGDVRVEEKSDGGAAPRRRDR